MSQSKTELSADLSKSTYVDMAQVKKILEIEDILNAISKNDIKLVSELLTSENVTRESLNNNRKITRTPILAAIESRNIEMVKLVIAVGGDKIIKGDDLNYAFEKCFDKNPGGKQNLSKSMDIFILLANKYKDFEKIIDNILPGANDYNIFYFFNRCFTDYKCYIRLRFKLIDFFLSKGVSITSEYIINCLECFDLDIFMLLVNTYIDQNERMNDNDAHAETEYTLCDAFFEIVSNSTCAVYTEFLESASVFLLKKGVNPNAQYTFCRNVTKSVPDRSSGSAISMRQELVHKKYEQVCFLSTAIKNGRRDVAEILIKADANVNQISEKNKTPLMIAAECKDVSSCRLLMKKKCDLMLQSSENMTAFDYAVDNWHPEIILLFLKAGCINNSAVGRLKRPFIYYIIDNNGEAIMQQLLKNAPSKSMHEILNSSINMPSPQLNGDVRPVSPFLYAYEKKINSLVKMMMPFITLNSDIPVVLCWCIENNDKSLLQNWVDKKININANFTYGNIPMTTIGLAIETKNTQLLDILLPMANLANIRCGIITAIRQKDDHSFNKLIELSDKTNWVVPNQHPQAHSPLTYAIFYEHYSAINYFIANKLFINWSDNNGRNAIWWVFNKLITRNFDKACYEKFCQIFIALINNGAVIENVIPTLFQDQDVQNTPLLWACYLGFEELIQPLLDKGADVLISDNTGCNALFLALYRGNFNIAFKIWSNLTLKTQKIEHLEGLNKQNQDVIYALLKGVDQPIASKEHFLERWKNCTYFITQFAEYGLILDKKENFDILTILDKRMRKKIQEDNIIFPTKGDKNSALMESGMPLHIIDQYCQMIRDIHKPSSENDIIRNIAFIEQVKDSRPYLLNGRFMPGAKTLLHLAIENQRYGVFIELMDTKAKINIPDAAKITAYDKMSLSQRKVMEIIRKLVPELLAKYEKITDSKQSNIKSEKEERLQSQNPSMTNTNNKSTDNKLSAEAAELIQLGKNCLDALNSIKDWPAEAIGHLNDKVCLVIYNIFYPAKANEFKPWSDCDMTYQALKKISAKSPLYNKAQDLLFMLILNYKKPNSTLDLESESDADSILKEQIESYFNSIQYFYNHTTTDIEINKETIDTLLGKSKVDLLIGKLKEKNIIEIKKEIIAPLLGQYIYGNLEPMPLLKEGINAKNLMLLFSHIREKQKKQRLEYQQQEQRIAVLQKEIETLKAQGKAQAQAQAQPDLKTDKEVITIQQGLTNKRKSDALLENEASNKAEKPSDSVVEPEDKSAKRMRISDKDEKRSLEPPAEKSQGSTKNRI